MRELGGWEISQSAVYKLEMVKTSVIVQKPENWKGTDMFPMVTLKTWGPEVLRAEEDQWIERSHPHWVVVHSTLFSSLVQMLISSETPCKTYPEIRVKRIVGHPKPQSNFMIHKINHHIVNNWEFINLTT